VGRIGGGTSVTAIAADAWLEVDVRATDAAGLAQLVREVQRAADAAVREERAAATVRPAPLTVALSSLGERPCGRLDDAHPLALAARDATLRIGRVPVAASASTDANVPLSLGIPAVAIGAGGRGGGAHTPDEWYENVQGAQGIARALGVVVAAAGLAAD
jgi:acetylornithine deacetylase/succinyl-diaminopimelate desuccinylase-like protein